jgi:nitrite reductase/ring-hydroxylating ferredoxin subunit
LKLVGRVRRDALADGAMVRLAYPPFDVLVTKLEGGETYGAIEDACNHAGASLVQGTRLARGRVSCPMHGYVFSLSTGELLVPKGLCDHQRRFRAEIDGDFVVIWDPFTVQIT